MQATNVKTQTNYIIQTFFSVNICIYIYLFLICTNDDDYKKTLIMKNYST